MAAEDWIGGLGAAAGLGFAKVGYDKVGKIGERAYDQFTGEGGLADVLSDRLKFQPYTVTTATGSNFGMSQSPSTGSQGRVNPDSSLFSESYNAANSSPEVLAAFAAGANSQASANELAAFNLGVPDTNSDGRLSNDEFTSWSGYDAYSEKNGPGILLHDGNNPGGMSGSRFTGQYREDGTPIYEQTGAGSGGGAGSAGGDSAAGGDPAAGQQYAPGAMDYKLNLSEDEQAFYKNRLSGSQGMFAAAETDTATREQQVFQRMMDSIKPQREREREALEERLQGQGRLGVKTSMFGGTPEGLAMAKAQEEAYSQNILGAMEFAGQEQSRQAQLGAGMLSAGYMPQAQLLGALQPGMTSAEQRRQSVSQATGAYGETYAAGLEALLTSALGQAGIAGNFGTGMATAALGGLFGK